MVNAHTISYARTCAHAVTGDCSSGRILVKLHLASSNRMPGYEASKTMGKATGTGVHEIAAEGFSLQVEEYERSRPGYPSKIVTELLHQLKLDEAKEARVLDLAAGTGKFTRRLVEQQNLQVLAVEPNEPMLAALRRHLPDVKALSGSATAIPAESGSLDAVFVAQGFHWFATEDACREIHRVLRPGGAFCCLWNREDVSVDWIHSILADFIEPLSDGAPQYFKGSWRAPFLESTWVRDAFGVQDVASHSTFHRHSIAITREQLWGRFLSKSYIALRSPAELKDLRSEYDRRLEKAGIQFDGPGGTEEVPLVLEIFVAHSSAT